MAAAPQSAMDKAELKKLLSLSKKEPVNCAIGMGKGPDPLLLLHKTKQPRAVLQEMEKEFGVLKAPCWGSAFVDTDGNPKLVVLTLNKGVSGMARKLVKTLKGTGFSKVEIKLEDGTVFESVGDEEADEAEGGEAEGEAPPAPPADIGALRGELMALIPQIPAAAGKDVAKLETLKKLAAAANAAVKAGDADAATAAIGAFRAAMGTSTAPSPAPEQKSGEFVTMQKSRLIWDSARKRVASEIGGLKAAVREEFDGDPEEAAALDALDQLDEIMAKFDERLIDTLDELLQETDPARHAELRDEAKELIGEYAAYASSNPLIKQLDGDTPLGVKLSIASTMTATLKALQASLR